MDKDLETQIKENNELRRVIGFLHSHAGRIETSLELQKEEARGGRSFSSERYALGVNAAESLEAAKRYLSESPTTLKFLSELVLEAENTKEPLDGQIKLDDVNLER